jgi:drug/metabolite transporter (DMT)-like permease
LLGEKVNGRQWAGLALGFVGVVMVVSGKLGDGALGPMLIPAVVALVGITAGTLYQKKFCPKFDLRTGSVIQFVPTALVTAIGVAMFEDYHIEWNGQFLFALGWLVLVLSLGAISLLNLLIRSGSAVNVASLFYLTPPTTALIAFFIFGENLSLTAAFGMFVAVSGVYLVARTK